MRRATHFVSVLAVVLFGLLTAGRPLATNAQDAALMSEAPGVVGSWQITVAAAQEPPFQGLGTFGADGMVLVSPPPVVPSLPHGPDTVIYTSAGHGAWGATGPDSAVFTFIFLGADAQGNPFAIVTVRASITLGADEQTFGGEFVRTIADPAGNTMATEPGTIQAARIVAEAPEISAATPLAGTPAA
jgi:hypothetical protein